MAAAGSPWALLALFAVVTIDGFFPPVPSESAVIALAALAGADGAPDLRVLGAVAAAGAFTGDQVAYAIGRRLAVGRVRVLRSARVQRAVVRAQAALAHRGAALIVGARFLPVGRVAVNMTAGAVGYSRRRFTVLAAIAAVTWAAYSIGLGVGAAHLLDAHHPLVGVAVGVLAGLLVGAVLDRVLHRLRRARPGTVAAGPRRRSRPDRVRSSAEG
ncbi:VTT domain-containing protein [Cellulomonas sp. ATA003]|uniref:DedA family protein n=1 Tax=Cellulomonas sp. ATA003 TaxID=3073064 RepID=UPI002873B62F|nr:VTT domain-containing protein [Cellulomonas sp. ATA003]WNB84576.1 VTT domain-containing protein [Cellulomonas sp. ATA003]